MTEFSVFEGYRRWLPTRRPEDDRRRRLLVLKRGFSSFAGSLRLSLGRPALAPSGAAADQIAPGNLSNLSEVVRIVLILTLRATRKSVPYRFVSSFSVSRLNKKGSPIGMLSKHMGEPFLFNGPPERIRTSDLCLRRATLYPAELRAVYGELLAVSGCIVYGFLLGLYFSQRRVERAQISAVVLMCA